MQLPDFEKVCELVHNAWMQTKLNQGITSRISEFGEEMMKPYAELSERCKDLDRGTVRAVYSAMEDLSV